MNSKKIWITAAYYASFIAMGVAMAALGPTLPGLAKNTGSTLGMIGILFTARSLGSLLVSGLSGRVYDRLPGHTVMSVMILIMAGLMALTPFVPVLWLLTLVLFISGAAQGLLNIGSNTLLVWLHGDSVGPFMNGLHLFFGLGTVIAPVVVAQFVDQSNGLKWIYLLLAAAVLPTAIVAFLPSPSPSAHPKYNPNEKSDVLLIVLISLVFCCYSGVSTGFSGWIYTYMLKLNLANAVDAAYLTSLFWIGLTAGRVVAIPLAIRFKPQPLLWVDFVGAFASLFFMLIWPGSRTALIITTAGLGFFLASIYPTTMSMAGQMMAISGRITGFFSIGSSAGMMAIPWIVGQLFETAGPQSLSIVLLLNLVIAFGVLIALALRTAPRPVPQKI